MIGILGSLLFYSCTLFAVISLLLLVALLREKREANLQFKIKLITVSRLIIGRERKKVRERIVVARTIRFLPLVEEY